MNWLLALLIKPFAAFVVICFALLLSRLLYRILPEGKIKKALFSPLPWYSGSRR
jgi:hypothetical protein